MFSIDHDFLAAVGITGLTRKEEDELLEHIYTELQQRIGTKVSEGLTDTQLTEFEMITDMGAAYIDTWIAANAPDYQEDPKFLKMLYLVGPEVPIEEVKAQFASQRWLEINRPNYQSLVTLVFHEVRRELIEEAPRLSGSPG